MAAHLIGKTDDISEPTFLTEMLHMPSNSETEPPMFGSKQLIHCVRTLTEGEAVTTINLGIHPDGTIGEKSRKIMRAMREAIRN